MALSPWPDTPAALREATAMLRSALGRGGNTSNPLVYDATDAEVQRLGAVAAARVENYADGAPDVVKDEAVIRFSAYLNDAASGSVVSEQVDELKMDHVVNHGPAFRNCGAMALLSPWKVRRGGAV